MKIHPNHYQLKNDKLEIVARMVAKGAFYGVVFGALVGFIAGFPVFGIGGIFGFAVGAYIGVQVGVIVSCVIGSISVLFFYPLIKPIPYRNLMLAMSAPLTALLMFWQLNSNSMIPQPYSTEDGLIVLLFRILPVVGAALLAIPVTIKLTSWYSRLFASDEANLAQQDNPAAPK
jgi:hypothetical protein